MSGRRRKEELFGGALLLKPHEAVADCGVAAETVGGNGGGNGRQSHGHGQGSGCRCSKALGTVGRLCSDREADGWAPHGFDFFPILSKTGSTLMKSKSVLILLQKFAIFACGSLGIL
jgi:hypothetical protein